MYPSLVRYGRRSRLSTRAYPGALTAGSNRVDTAKLAAILGAAEVRRATPEEARAATGYAIGGTPPFGFPEAVRTMMDRDLLPYEEQIKADTLAVELRVDGELRIEKA